MNVEETLLTRAKEEREKLFERYSKGREPTAEIDPWEDPAWEVYHQTDRYGFIHDKRLPQKIDPNEAKQRSIEMERVKKWLKMTHRWTSKDTEEKLRTRIYKGIPDKLRSQVWIKLLNIEERIAEQKNVYQNMLKLAQEWCTEARQIDSDVNRQFREHLFFRERYSIKQKSLFNVLTAYSMYNMEVGYCQGMSGVAGVLLMYMDEEQAFWALSELLADRKFAMHGLYIEGFPKLNRLIQHHDRILEKCLPKLKHHFDMYNLDSMIYSLKWFFVIFIERIPFSLCLRVWDIYLFDGQEIVSAMAYTILKLHQKKLTKLKDMDLLIQYLQTTLHKDFGYDDNTVIKCLEQSIEELKKAKLYLAPTPQSIEFPKRQFGEFVEPSNDTKIGRRKSIFTDRERETTENVLSRNENKIQKLSDSTIVDINGLNSGNIPESEDGGSFLGSSRKSLADTSITSTADLSAFSTGQKSHQVEVYVDESKCMYTDDDEEGSSLGSGFRSLHIIDRPASSLIITPTPRAVSPNDIVRIYIPPAQDIPMTTNKKQTLLNGSSQNSSIISRTPTSNINSLHSTAHSYKRQPNIYKSAENLTLNKQLSASSFRHRSLTRKTSLLFTNNHNFTSCEHLRNKRGSLEISDNEYIHIDNNSYRSGHLDQKQILTSFEKLAKLEKVDGNIIYLEDKNSVLQSSYKGENKNNVQVHHQRLGNSPTRRKCESDSNIKCNKNKFDNSPNSIETAYHTNYDEIYTTKKEIEISDSNFLYNENKISVIGATPINNHSMQNAADFDETILSSSLNTLNTCINKKKVLASTNRYNTHSPILDGKYKYNNRINIYHNEKFPAVASTIPSSSPTNLDYRNYIRNDDGKSSSSHLHTSSGNVSNVSSSISDKYVTSTFDSDISTPITDTFDYKSSNMSAANNFRIKIKHKQ